MKWACRLLAFGFLPVATSAVMASTEAMEDAGTRQVETMSFAQCAELIRNYEDQFGPAHVVIEAPALRVVQFANRDATEQVTCDGEDNLITFFELKSD